MRVKKHRHFAHVKRNPKERKKNFMNRIVAYILVGFMALVGGGSTIYIVVSLFAMILYKAYGVIVLGRKWSD